MDLERQGTESVSIKGEVLRELMHDVLQRLNVPAHESSIVTETLLEASLSGYDSHGVMRIPMYVDGLRRGTMIPGAKIKVVHETAACAHLDGGWGLGPVVATHAMRLASKKANETGVGCVSVIHANDVARLGSYVIAPAQDGLIALMMVNDAGGGPSVAPWGGVQPFLSTNPIAAGIPRKNGPPMIIDMSASMVAVGKLRMHANRGERIPQGWMIDEDGRPAYDPSAFFADPKRGAILPLGGMLAGYKGFALGLLVDILAGALGGAGCSTGVDKADCGNGIFVLVIDPKEFSTREDFAERVEGFVSTVKGSKKAPGVEEIMVPGERALRSRRTRSEKGIPVDLPTWERITELLNELGIERKYGPP